MANMPINDPRLIQDNDRKHTSALCQQAIADNGINWVFKEILEFVF
jgi:hypothetical protein